MKKTLWHIYFWGIVALDIIGFVLPQSRRIFETIDTAIVLVALMGLFGFCFEKKMLSRLFWQIFFAGFVIWVSVYYFILPPLPAVTEHAMHLRMPVRIVTTFGLLPHIPLFVALYLYAIRRSSIWQEPSE